MTEAGTDSGDSKDVINFGRFSFKPGRIFKGAEVTADPDKIQHIGQEGRPGSIEDVQAPRQTTGYNAKYD